MEGAQKGGREIIGELNSIKDSNASIIIFCI